MEAVLEKGISQKKYTIENDSMESWQIEKQLAEINVPYLPISWKDEFLMAENLQNYFAEVIAGYSLLELNEENRENADLTKLKQWDLISFKVIKERNKYHNYSLKERQKLLIWLMKESKEIEILRSKRK